MADESIDIKTPSANVQGLYDVMTNQARLWLTQFPALVLALGVIAVLLGWVNSPMLDEVKVLTMDHRSLMKFERSVCLNVADLQSDPMKHDRAIARCESE